MRSTRIFLEGVSRYPLDQLVHDLMVRCAAVLRGTVNDPTPFPDPSRVHGSHHWAFERLLSVALIPMTVSAFVVSPTAYPVLDGVLAMSLVVHSHIGVSMDSTKYINIPNSCYQY